MHDTPFAALPHPEVASTRFHFTSLLAELEPALAPFEPVPVTPRRRGRPRHLCASHLWLGLLMCTLLGMDSYAELWRLLHLQWVARFAPVAITSWAIVQRLQKAGLAPLFALNERLGPLLNESFPIASACTLAPFAPQIVAFDETTLDVVHKHLPALRPLPKGDPGLLAGKVSALFNIRTQQWVHIQFRADVLAHCSVNALSVLETLVPDTLVLFDLGYFAFDFFDALTMRHLGWVTRLRSDVKYTLAHTHYRHEGTLDALVWLGAKHSARAGHLVRLVRYWDGTASRSYLTNMLDPSRLPLGEVVQLYGRRWDIELAFLTLKEHVGLHHLWSGKQSLILQQLWVMLMLASLYHRLRLHLASQLDLDPFDLSLPLLLRYLPQMMSHEQEPRGWLIMHGRSLEIIRPSSRRVRNPPLIPCTLIVLPPPDLVYVRLPRVVIYKPRASRKKKPSNGEGTS